MSTFLNRLAAAEQLHRAICHDWCFPDAEIKNDPSFGPFVTFSRYRAYCIDGTGKLYRIFVNIGGQSLSSKWVPLSKPETLAGVTCFIYSMDTAAVIDSSDEAIEISDGDLQYFEKWQATTQ